MTTKEQNAAAERERKARIKRAHARLDALEPDARDAVVAAAEEKEAAARDAGSRRAHIAFVEDALVAWEVGGRAMEAAAAGKPLDTNEIAQMVQRVSKEIRGDVGSPDLREQALEEVGRRGVHARQEGGGAAAKAGTRTRKARESRGTGADREERCPECGKWRPAAQDRDGAYLKTADFRAGRGDCRACYNKRWLEGKARRQAARAS